MQKLIEQLEKMHIVPDARVLSNSRRIIDNHNALLDTIIALVKTHQYIATDKVRLALSSSAKAQGYSCDYCTFTFCDSNCISKPCRQGQDFKAKAKDILAAKVADFDNAAKTNSSGLCVMAFGPKEIEALRELLKH